MSPKNAKRIVIRIVNPPEGCRDRTSLEHARRYVRREVAEFTPDGRLQFLHHRRAEHGPTVEVESVDVATWTELYVRADSGFSMLPYPLASSPDGPIARRYPVLARAGAGL